MIVVVIFFQPVGRGADWQGGTVTQTRAQRPAFGLLADDRLQAWWAAVALRARNTPVWARRALLAVTVVGLALLVVFVVSDRGIRAHPPPPPTKVEIQQAVETQQRFSTMSPAERLSNSGR